MNQFVIIGISMRLNSVYMPEAILEKCMYILHRFTILVKAEFHWAICKICVNCVKNIGNILNIYGLPAIKLERAVST